MKNTNQHKKVPNCRQENSTRVSQEAIFESWRGLYGGGFGKAESRGEDIPGRGNYEHKERRMGTSLLCGVADMGCLLESGEHWRWAGGAAPARTGRVHGQLSTAALRHGWAKTVLKKDECHALRDEWGLARSNRREGAPFYFRRCLLGTITLRGLQSLPSAIHKTKNSDQIPDTSSSAPALSILPVPSCHCSQHHKKPRSSSRLPEGWEITGESHGTRS